MSKNASPRWTQNGRMKVQINVLMDRRHKITQEFRVLLKIKEIDTAIKFLEQR